MASHIIIMTRLFLFSLLVASVATSPLKQQDDIVKRQDMLEESWPGINWKRAYETCGSVRTELLAEATRMAFEVVNYDFARTRNNPAFHRYFVDNYHPTSGWFVSHRYRYCVPYSKPWLIQK